MWLFCLQGERDKAKYDKARELGRYIGDIREGYYRDMEDANEQKVKQRYRGM